MGIPDPRPASLWGAFSLNQFRLSLRLRYDWSGNLIRTTDGSGTDHLLRSKRNGKSGNPRLPLAATVTQWAAKVVRATVYWRSPSAYDRSIQRYEFVQKLNWNSKARNKSLGLSYYETYEGDPSIGGSAPFMKNNPEFWNNPFGNPSAIVSVNRRARLITECLLKIKDQKLSLGENLATALQTYNLFAKNATTFFESLLAAKRGNWKSVARHLGLSGPLKSRGSWSARYLEYIYGWKPLMQDIYGGWELLNEQLPPALLVHATRKLSKSHSDSYVGFSTPNSRKYEIQEYFHGYDKLSLTGRLSDVYARECARAGLINPASVAWEVVPYSFLIDWGMPIGNVLEALDASAGLTFVGGYLSSRQEGTWSVKESHWTPSGVQCETSQPGILATFAFSNVREKVTGWPFPQIYAKSPFSTTHAANALALFRQLTRRS